MAAPEKVKQIVASHVIRPIATFIQSQASSGILLMGLTLVALVWANSRWSQAYQDVWHLEFALQFGGQSLSLSLHEWINDGLMAVFFLLVGLEIKREVLVGELATPKLAALPIMAAIGGMAVPALVFVFINQGEPTMKGWAVPMATDIAFSLGVLALLGSRAPLALKVFLTALAIVDDLGAVLVIAFFYSGQLDFTALTSAGALFLTLFVLNFFGVRKLTPYLLIGFVMWLTMLKSGIHATIAGVLLAVTIPTRVRMNVPEFLTRSRDLVTRFERLPRDETGLLNEEEQTTLHAIEKAVEGVQMPLQRLESTLHTPVNFVIMPIFALANAGVVLSGVGVNQVMEPLTLGIVLALVLGKSVGITLFAWLSVKFGLAVLPNRVRWKQVVGVAFLGGIGFTMSLFIAGLAFTDPEHLVGAKLGILLGSLVAGILGAALIVWSKKGRAHAPVEPE